MRSMAEELRSAFIRELKEVAWMDEETRAAALEKAYRLTYRIAHPDYFTNDTFMELYWKDTRLNPYSSPLHAAMTMKVPSSSSLPFSLRTDWDSQSGSRSCSGWRTLPSCGTRWTPSGGTKARPRSRPTTHPPSTK